MLFLLVKISSNPQKSSMMNSNSRLLSSVVMWSINFGSIIWIQLWGSFYIKSFILTIRLLFNKHLLNLEKSLYGSHYKKLEFLQQENFLLSIWWKIKRILLGMKINSIDTLVRNHNLHKNNFSTIIHTISRFNLVQIITKISVIAILN